MLPVEQYPQITPPVVKINANYPGANALTVSQAVATPIEQELNGTPGMIYMQSNCSNSGNLNITVTFDVSADPDCRQSRCRTELNWQRAVCRQRWFRMVFR